MKSGSLFLLLAERIDRTHGLGRQSVEQVRGLGHRSLDVAGELGEQLRARLEVCQLLGAFSIVDGAISEAALMISALLVLAKSRRVFAASMKSPFTKVTAVGPARSSSRPSMQLPWLQCERACSLPQCRKYRGLAFRAVQRSAER